MIFSNKPPRWDAAGREPNTELQTEGFKAGYKPPAPFFNYLFNKTTAAINEIQTKLSNVENTADKDKPISTAQQKAIDNNVISGYATGNPVSITDAATAPLNDIKVRGASKFEPYTGGKPSPSPEYPQVIHSAGDNGKFAIRTCKENLFDVENFVKLIKSYSATAFIETISGRKCIVFNNTDLHQKDFRGVFPYFKEKTQYTWSMYIRAYEPAETVPDCNIYLGIFKDNEEPTEQNLANLTAITCNRKQLEFTRKSVTIPVGSTGVAIGISYGEPAKYAIDLDSIQLEENATATEYKQYKGTNAAMSITEPLYSIPVSSGGNYTDENEQQWICNEIDLARGVYIKRIEKVVFTGAESGWRSGAFTTDPNLKYVYLTNTTIENVALSLCTHGVFSYDTAFWENGQYMRSGSDLWQTLTNQTLDEWKAYVSQQYSNGTPITLYYPLTTPIETSLTTEQIIALQSLQSYEGVTNVFADELTTLEIEYFQNTDNGKAAANLKADNNRLWQTIGDVNSVLESIIGGA